MFLFFFVNLEVGVLVEDLLGVMDDCWFILFKEGNVLFFVGRVLFKDFFRIFFIVLGLRKEIF